MRPLTDRVDNHTGYLLIKLGADAAARFERALVPLGLRGRHIRVLEFIHGETLSQQDLCLRTGMDRTTMVAVVDELEHLGYARRERKMTDRRKHVITLTEPGAAAFAAAAERLAKTEDEILAPLSGDERDHLHHLVTRLFADQQAVCSPDQPTTS